MSRSFPWFTLCLVSCLSGCTSSEATPVLSGNYLGQDPPGLTAQLFAAGFVSTQDNELNAVFANGNQEFYFTRRGLADAPPAIMVTRRGSSHWTTPEVVDFGDRYATIDLFITPDGSLMVFCSNRPRRPGGRPRSDYDFWASTKEGDSWGLPELFAPAALSDSQDFYPILTGNGSLYFNSQREGPGTNNIYRSSIEDGQYGPAEKLPEPINSEFREFDAYVSPDEDLIIFSSERPGGQGGSDIYVSFLQEESWTDPVILGGEVNSPASEYGAMLSPDGRYLFFTSGRDGNENVYWVSAGILDSMRPIAELDGQDP